MEAAGFRYHLEVSWRVYAFELLFEMLDTVLPLIDEPEDDLVSNDLAMVQRHLESDQWRSGLTCFVPTRSAETVDVDDSAMPRAQDRKPRCKVPAQNVMLGPRVGVQYPQGLFWRGHTSPIPYRLAQHAWTELTTCIIYLCSVPGSKFTCKVLNGEFGTRPEDSTDEMEDVYC